MAEQIAEVQGNHIHAVFGDHMEMAQCKTVRCLDVDISPAKP